MSCFAGNRCKPSSPVPGMRWMLNALLLLNCVYFANCLPAINNVEGRANSTLLTPPRYVALDNNAAVNRNISEKAPPSPATSSVLSSTSPQPSTSFSSSSIVEPITSAVTSSSSPNISTTGQPSNSATVVYNTSVEATTVSDVNITKLNGSLGEYALMPGAADSVFNVTVIVGISSLVILIIILIGVTSFLLYRHFSWNRPQTLSDKFSNDESTGYIDDSAFRENSEEMYSLDNDSFLNSLEAMTIQNYWTDNVKHTKL